MKKYFVTFKVGATDWNCTISAENKPEAEVMARYKAGKEFPEYMTGKKKNHLVQPTVKIKSCSIIDFEF